MSRSKKAGLAVVVATVFGASGAAAVAQTNGTEPCEDPYTCPAEEQVDENEPAVLGEVTGPTEVLPSTSPAPAVAAQPTFTG